MSIMTEDQVKLLHKLQLMRHPAFVNVNPVSTSAEEATELFKMNLPLLEHMTAGATTHEREHVEKTFYGMNEYDCNKQINRWTDDQNLVLDYRPNPYFGNGEEWLKYFEQPISQVNIGSLEKHFAQWEIKIPKETMTHENGQKETFSRLELAFDDVRPDKLQFAVEKQKERDTLALNRVTPEQRAAIKALQTVGKAPVIDRKAYLSMTRNDADAYLKQHEKNQENTFPTVEYLSRKPPEKAEAFPEFKSSNLLGHYPADYLQRSILRDLAAEGHIATPETRAEFMEKLPFITQEQAKEFIEPHKDTPAGAGLLEQCRAYCEFGQVQNTKEIQTINDVRNLYNINRSFDFDTKSALRDLIDGGYIQSEDGHAKIQYTTEAMDESLLAKFGDAPMGPRIRGKLMDLIEDGTIGSLEDNHFQHLSVREAMHIISSNSEMERFKHQATATDRQKALLRTMEQRGQIDLKKVDMEHLTVKAAHTMIDGAIQNNPRHNWNGPATDRQKALLRSLIVAGMHEAIPREQWQNLTKQQASDFISSVPEEKRQEIAAAPRMPMPSAGRGMVKGPEIE